MLERYIYTNTGNILAEYQGEYLRESPKRISESPGKISGKIPKGEFKYRKYPGGIHRGESKGEFGRVNPHQHQCQQEQICT